MAEVKMTKAMWFEAIKANLAEEWEDREEAMAFIDTQIEALANKAAKAKERAAEKKAKEDELLPVVEAVLTEELQTAEDITAHIEGEGVTKAKVVARLKKLVDAGVAVKEKVKVEKSTKMAYRLA